MINEQMIKHEALKDNGVEKLDGPIIK